MRTFAPNLVTKMVFLFNSKDGLISFVTVMMSIGQAALRLDPTQSCSARRLPLQTCYRTWRKPNLIIT